MTSPDTQHDQAHQHGHSHVHADGQVHSHDAASAAGSEAAQLGPSMNGTVMLDIGGDFGALMLFAPESMALDEIEISPVGSDDSRTHVAIRERRGPGGTQWAAIYPKLLRGEYTLWSLDGTAAGTVTIVGGEVAQVDWR